VSCSVIDKCAPTRLIARVIRALALLSALVFVSPAAAMVGDAAPADAALTRQLALIVGSNGSYCSGAVLAPRLLLTATHCVPAGPNYKLVQFGGNVPVLKDITAVARHPAFTARGMTTYRGTADVALMQLREPLPPTFQPATLGPADFSAKVGDRLTVAGFGVTRLGDPRSGGTARAAVLIATGRPDSMDLRLMDPATRNTRAGRGACTGDSGGPVFADDNGHTVVIGVISWTTGPNTTRGCGGLTGVTPLARYRDWIVGTARKLGAVLQ
jgi:secreted trypsin-like serine protease